MKRVLSTEEWIAKRRAEGEERRKRAKPPKEYKTASVTAYRAFTQVSSQATYGAAFPDPRGYEEFFTGPMSAADLGQEARTAVMASRFITPDHPEWDEVIHVPKNEEIKAWQEDDKARAGVKTSKALFNGAGHVSLDLRDGEIRIKPWRYRGRGHWEGIPGREDETLPEDVSDEELEVAIRNALETSRSA